MENNEIIRRRKIGKTISKSMNLKYDVQSILNISTRTAQKILKRMWEVGKLKCSNCGWDKTVGDVHHINGRKIENADSHNNLTYLCPNCHRLAHRKLLNKFITLEEQIGNDWMNYFYGFRTRKPQEEILKKRKICDENRIYSINKYENRKLLILNSNIDYSKFGWGVHLSKLLNITPQKSKKWVQKNMPAFYKEKCYRK
jgi:hypothetical protein